MVGVVNCCYGNKGKLPNRVLDIGAGSNAVAIALGFCVENDLIEVVASEPSHAMRDFALYEKDFSNINIQFLPDSIEEIVQEYRQGAYVEDFLYYRYFDTITISSALAYYFSGMDDLWWQHFSEALQSLSTDDATLIIIEPDAKRQLLERKLASAENSGWLLKDNQSKLLSEMLPNVQSKELKLPRLTALQSRYVNWWNVTSWNSYSRYVEHILIFQKR